MNPGTRHPRAPVNADLELLRARLAHDPEALEQLEALIAEVDTRRGELERVRVWLERLKEKVGSMLR